VTPNVAAIVLLSFTSTGNPIELAWSAPTENVDGSAIVAPLTYNVYRSHNGAAYKLTVHAGISTTKATISNVTAGATECFEVTAIEGGVESSRSLPSCITVP